MLVHKLYLVPTSTCRDMFYKPDKNGKEKGPAARKSTLSVDQLADNVLRCDRHVVVAETIEHLVASIICGRE